MSPNSKVSQRNHFTIDRGRYRCREEFPIYHDRLPQELLSGYFALEIKVLKSLHVGSGDFTVGEDGRAIKDIARLRGAPIIPGSSLKGACRQTYELFTASPQAPGKNDREPIEEHRRNQRLSRAAVLFGCLGYQGRASFDDAISETACMAERIMISVAHPSTRSQENGYRFYGDLPKRASQSRTIPAYAIPPGAALKTYLRLRNITREEVGGLLLSLGIDSFSPRLGGAKYDGLGSVRFSVTSYHLHAGLGNDEKKSDKPEQVDSFVKACISAFPLSPTAQKALKDLIKELPLRGKQGVLP